MEVSGVSDDYLPYYDVSSFGEFEMASHPHHLERGCSIRPTLHAVLTISRHEATNDACSEDYTCTALEAEGGGQALTLGGSQRRTTVAET
jgi:hypothetical protein